MEPEDINTPETAGDEQQQDDVVSTPDETESDPEDATPQDASLTVVAEFAVGDTVRIKESFPSYRGELGTVTAVRKDRIGGDFMVADVELQKQRSVIGDEPIWFSNVPFSQLEKVG